MSDNWISDLLILNELENQRMSKNPDDTGPGGLILVVVGIFLVLTVSYPAALLLQYRRKDWLALGLTLVFGAVAFLWAWPRLIVSEGEGLWFLAVTVGAYSVFGYLVYFFCQRWNRKIAQGAPLHFSKWAWVVLVSLGLAAFYFLWMILISLPFVTEPIFWWLSQFLNMQFESLPGAVYVYPKLAWPFIIAGAVLVVAPLQAWFRRRAAEGKAASPLALSVAAVPASLFSLFWTCVFIGNFFD